MPELSGFEIDHRNSYYEFSIWGRCSLAFNTAVLCKISCIRQRPHKFFSGRPSCHSLALNVVRGSTQSLRRSEKLNFVASCYIVLTCTRTELKFSPCRCIQGFSNPYTCHLPAQANPRCCLFTVIRSQVPVPARTTLPQRYHYIIYLCNCCRSES